MKALILIALASFSAFAGPAVLFTACSQETCAALSDANKKAVSTDGVLMIQPSIIVAVSGVPGCALCAKLATADKQTFFVLGPPKTVACKLYGGDACKAGE